MPLALTVDGYRINEPKKSGAPIDGVVLPSAFALPTGIAALMKSPHPFAALLLLYFYLADGQRILAAPGNVPTNRTVARPPPGLGPIDVAKFRDQEDRRTKLFRQTFAGGAR